MTVDRWVEKKLFYNASPVFFNNVTMHQPYNSSPYEDAFFISKGYRETY